MSGFIVLHRDATEHPLLLGDAARFGAWFWLVAKACWKPTRFNLSGKLVTLERGQLCVSRAQLSAAWGMSPSAVERFLTRLETEQMIGRATGQGRTIITIENYDKYQVANEQTGQATGQATGQPPDSHRTTKEQGNKGTRVILDAEASSGGRGVEDEGGNEHDLFEPASPQDPAEPGLKPDHVVESWNVLAKKIGRPCVRELTPERRTSLKARIAGYSIDDFRQVLASVERSPFLRGERNWPGVTFDWIIKKNNFLKILEGNYDG